MKNRKTAWMKNVLPHVESSLKIIQKTDLEKIFMLNKFALSEEGKILDANLLVDLCYFYITFMGCDRLVNFS